MYQAVDSPIEITITNVERVEVAECEDDGNKVEPSNVCG